MPRTQSLVACVYNGRIKLHLTNPYFWNGPLEALQDVVSEYMSEDSPGRVDFQFDTDNTELAIKIASEEMLEDVYVHVQDWGRYQPWSEPTDTGFLVFKQAVIFAVPKDGNGYEVAFTHPQNTATPESIKTMEENFVARLGGTDGDSPQDALPDYHVRSEILMWQVA